MDHRARHDRLRGLLRERASQAAKPAGDTDCVRLCAGLADGLPGMIVDQFGPLLVAVDYSAPTHESPGAEALLRIVRECRPGCHVVAKARAVTDGTNRYSTASFTPEAAQTPLIGTELGLKFEIGTDPAHDFGLFLDAAKARAFVRGAARGRRVLNLFSYAGAFGIAAAVGGAAEVTNVDPNRDYLTWSIRNAQLNGVSVRVLPDTAQAHLAKHLRRMSREPGRPGYDMVILDPPAFGVGRGPDRVLRLLWPSLFESLRAIRPAVLLLMCNDKAFQSRRSFVDLVEEELGASYRFERLGTCLRPTDLGDKPPRLSWSDAPQDPFYVEPVVLAGKRVP
jgi:23S rRNA (cytosine1962-C5)-methyltransferase